MNTISIITITVVCIISAYTIYLTNLHKEEFTNLNGIVSAVTTAAMSAIISGYLIGVLSGDLFLSSGVGIIIGFIIGFLGGQPVGIMPVLIGSSSGFMGGLIGALAGVNIKDENPYLLLLIFLVFYVIILGLVILFIRIIANKKLKIDTKAISPFAIISAGIVFLSLFLFLYSSDIIKVSNTNQAVQSQNNEGKDTPSNSSDSSGSTSGTIEVDATKDSTPKIKMEVTPTGYSPNVIKIRKGVPVEIDVHNTLENSCLSVINLPDFNLNNINLKIGTTNLTFTPSRAGEYTFSCGMDMYKGKIIVE